MQESQLKLLERVSALENTTLNRSTGSVWDELAAKQTTKSHTACGDEQPRRRMVEECQQNTGTDSITQPTVQQLKDTAFIQREV